MNYPGSTSATRNPEFRKVMHGLSPDILVVQEMTSAAGMSEFQSAVLDLVAPATFAHVPFNDGPDSDNGLFYRTDTWDFVRASYISTALRDIAGYVVRPKYSADELHIYSVHLKASSGSSNEQLRLDEATILRDHLNSLPAGTQFVIVGDYNIYRSSEPAWQKLIGNETINTGRAFDPLNMTGTWNSITFSQHHTQSPRVRSFGGGATGGLDDRFDIILTSSTMADRIITSSYTAYGNDGNHYNDSINRLPNTAVPDSIAHALHNASDHLPVTALFAFPRTIVPVQLASFTGSVNATGDSVVLEWRTVSETNNYGFELQRRVIADSGFVTVPNGFIPGRGTTLHPQYYRFAEVLPIPPGSLSYRLKQIDLDGTIHLFEPIHLNIVLHIPASTPISYTLSQNYPNPFNPTTRIEFSVPNTTYASIVLSDVLGREVSSLFNDTAEGGVMYSVDFNAISQSAIPLPSGVYFYRLVLKNSTGAFPISITRRMILVR
ncbi:MAG: T9SS type A sorting domain-containing protein [Bacteroidetes bacterium]|nr:T9SS type A sorting domain-containing protein [Bacteroidota bacterium]MCW5897065.1 T9SS type A sorting domain-containing protein [Bacteroidota bacterium]